MADDTNQPNEVVEESPVDESVKPSEAPVEPDQPAEEVQTEAETAEPPAIEESEEKPPSRRETLRVQNLLRKYGPPPENAPSQNSPNFRDKVDADEEIYNTLEETAKQFGSEQYSAGINQAQFSTWQRFLQMDEKAVRSQYDVFNPAKEDTYHKAAEEAMQQKYLRFVGFDAGDPAKGRGPSIQSPDISYSDFVEAEMEFADELASQRTTRTTQNIAKQAASTGLRPDGSTPTRLNLDKAAEDMTDEELEAKIQATMPRDSRGRFTANK